MMLGFEGDAGTALVEVALALVTLLLLLLMVVEMSWLGWWCETLAVAATSRIGCSE